MVIGSTTGAQEVALSVCLSVCAFYEFFSQSSLNLHAVSQIQANFKTERTENVLKLCFKSKSKVPNPSPAKQSQSQGSWTLG